MPVTRVGQRSEMISNTFASSLKLAEASAEGRSFVIADRRGAAKMHSIRLLMNVCRCLRESVEVTIISIPKANLRNLKE